MYVQLILSKSEIKSQQINAKTAPILNIIMKMCNLHNKYHVKATSTLAIR